MRLYKKIPRRRAGIPGAPLLVGLPVARQHLVLRPPAIINAILFGQYERLLKKTLAQVENKPAAKILQLTCVYGKLTPALLSAPTTKCHLCDAATGQLQLARRKTRHAAERCHLARHECRISRLPQRRLRPGDRVLPVPEMPAAARENTYAEIARVVRAGGSVLITEYAATPQRHLLYWFPLTRWVLGRLEPFLPGFWQEDVAAKLGGALERRGKALAGEPHIEHCFAGFYRVMRFNVKRN